MSEFDQRVKINVGGRIFETTVPTLRSSGPDSLLHTLSNRDPSQEPEPIFIDRDPDVFSTILTLLRTRRLPSSATRSHSIQELLQEANYFGLESILRQSLSPDPLNAIDAQLTSTIKSSSNAVVSDFDPVDSDSSIWVAHGGQVSLYDWSLSHAGTVRTHFDLISSVKSVGPEVCAVGSVHGSGLHFYSVVNGRRVNSVDWADPSDVRIYKARVHAIADSDGFVYASYDCQHGENCVLMIDKLSGKVLCEIGRMPGNSSKNTVPTKLNYVSSVNLLLGSSVTSGAFGYSGYVRLWDPRSKDVVWETNEPGSGRSSRFGDSFADIAVDCDETALFKVCSKSGDLAMADMRKLSDDPWIYLKEKNPSFSLVGGNIVENYVLSCYRRQVFVGRGGELEVWSRIGNEENEEEMYRRNYVDKVEDKERGVIKKIEGGGDRLFLCREDVEGIEVWESSCSSGIVLDV